MRGPEGGGPGDDEAVDRAVTVLNRHTVLDEERRDILFLEEKT